MKLWGLEWSALDSYFQFVEQSASPSTPESGHIRLYSKDSSSISTLCYKNDAGNEVCMPTAAGTLVTGLGVATRVAFWDSVSNLTSDADLTFATDTLSATKLASSVLTATQLVYAGAAGLLSSISELTFVPTAANSSIITLGDDSHTGVINTPAGLTINIDSNNNDTGALLAIQVNTALRLTGGTRLFTINESGALGLGNGVDFGVSGQALITQGNAAAPTWVTLVTDHGALTGLSDDDHTQYSLFAFKTISVSGQSDVVADVRDDTLTLVAGTGITLTTSAAGDSVTITHSANALLDGSNHTDTVAQTVSRGSLIYGNATPKWDELTVGASAGMFLRTDATDAMWSTLILPNAATANRLVYATASNTYGESGDLTYDGTDLAIASGKRFRMQGQNRFRYLNSICIAYLTTNQTGIAVNTAAVVSYDAEEVDTDTIHSVSANKSRFTVPLAGKWLFVGNLFVDFTSAVGPNLATALIWKNGSTAIRYGNTTVAVPTVGVNTSLQVVAVVDMAANDYVEMAGVLAATSGTWDIVDVGSLRLTRLEGYYIGE